MIEIGKKQKLTVVKTVDFGVYLGEDVYKRQDYHRVLREGWKPWQPSAPRQALPHYSHLIVLRPSQPFQQHRLRSSFWHR